MCKDLIPRVCEALYMCAGHLTTFWRCATFFDGNELQEAAAAAIDMEGAHAGAALGGQGMNGQQGPAARVAGLDSSSLAGCWNTE
jgi:hypothetical protein